MTAKDYTDSLKYDTWIGFWEIPDKIKRDVIELMDGDPKSFTTWIWEGDWFKKVLRSDVI